MKKAFLAYAFVALLSAGACSATGDLPEDKAALTYVQMPDTFTMQGGNAPSQAERWYEALGDADLAILIDDSLKNNFEIKAALARLDAARAITRQTRAGLFPALNAEGAARDSIEDGNSREGTAEIGAALSWEVDVFGRLRSLTDADALEARARAEDVQALALSLSADIARNYYSAVAEQNQLQLLQAQEKLDREFLDLLDLRFESGIGTRVDVLQQQGQLVAIQSLIPQSQASLRVFENRLDVLIGVAPDGQNRSQPQDDFSNTTQLPAVGVPASLLLKRPDLRALQSRLRAQDAEIDAAIADRLPRLTLDGSYALADGPGFTGPVGVLIGGFIQPLIDWGRRRAAVAENEALFQELMAEYTQRFLEAVEEVENALYQENRQREYIERLRQRLAILQETVEQAQAQYEQGISDYITVIESLKELRAVERDMIREHLNIVLFRIDLYRAIGGAIPAVYEQPNTGNME